jgi:hypothetical protein
MKFTDERLARICSMNQVPDWRPTIDPRDREVVLATLGLCESNLEVMYALGALFRLEFNAMRAIEVAACTTEVAGRLWRALWFQEPWDGFGCPRCRLDGGPSGVVLVPQLALRGRIWDWGLVFTADNGSPNGSLFGLLEVDGYQVHRPRRGRDRAQRQDAAACGVPVFGCQEELHDPLFWFDAVTHHYWAQGLWPDAARCVVARPCNLFLPLTDEAA